MEVNNKKQVVEMAFPVYAVMPPDKLGNQMILLQSGMSLRDYFAAQAMSLVTPWSGVTNYSEVARQSYELADQMIKARGNV